MERSKQADRPARVSRSTNSYVDNSKSFKAAFRRLEKVERMVGRLTERMDSYDQVDSTRKQAQKKVTPVRANANTLGYQRSRSTVATSKKEKGKIRKTFKPPSRDCNKPFLRKGGNSRRLVDVVDDSLQQVQVVMEDIRVASPIPSVTPVKPEDKRIASPVSSVAPVRHTIPFEGSTSHPASLLKYKIQPLVVHQQIPLFHPGRRVLSSSLSTSYMPNPSFPSLRNLQPVQHVVAPVEYATESPPTVRSPSNSVNHAAVVSARSNSVSHISNANPSFEAPSLPPEKPTPLRITRQRLSRSGTANTPEPKEWIRKPEKKKSTIDIHIVDKRIGNFK